MHLAIPICSANPKQQQIIVALVVTHRFCFPEPSIPGFKSSASNRQFESYRHYRADTKAPAKAATKREASEISFHSLRHSAVTMLKAAGVSDFIAREIVGHESAAVSRQYTHLTTDDKRAAMRRLPDVTRHE